MQDLIYNGKHISQSQLDELHQGSYWSWLFSENRIVGDIIKLKSFKIDAIDLKETTAMLSSSQTTHSFKRNIEQANKKNDDLLKIYFV
jgi:hypothetical protein